MALDKSSVSTTAMQTDKFPQMDRDTEQKITSLLEENAELKCSVKTMSSQLKNWDKKLETEYSQWKKRELFLEAKIVFLVDQIQTLHLDETGANPSSDEPPAAESCQQCGDVSDQVGRLQQQVTSLTNQLDQSKSKESAFEAQRKQWCLREKEQGEKIKLLENQLKEQCLREKEQGEKIKLLENQLKEQRNKEYRTLVDSLQRKQLQFDEEKQELEKRVDDSETKLEAAQEQLVEKEKALQKSQEQLVEKEEAFQKVQEQQVEKEEAFQKVQEQLVEKEEALQKGQEQNDTRKDCEVLKELKELKQIDQDRLSIQHSLIPVGQCQKKQETIQTQTDMTMDMKDDLTEEVENLLGHFEETVFSFELKLKTEKNELEKRVKDFQPKLEANQEQLVDREKDFQKAQEEWSLEKQEALSRDCQELQEIHEKYEKDLNFEQQLNAALELECQTLRNELEQQKNGSVDKIHEKVPVSETATQTELCVDESQLLKQQQGENAELRDQVQTLHGKLEAYETSQVEFETERKEWKDLEQELVSRAIDAEKQLEKARHDLAQAQQSFQEDREDVTRVMSEEDLFDQKSLPHAEVSELKWAEEEKAAFRGHLERCDWISQQPDKESELAIWMGKMTSLFKDNTTLHAMYVKEKEKVAQLEENMEGMLQRANQEKMQIHCVYMREMESVLEREDQAVIQIVELSNANTQLEKQLQEAKESFDHEQALREEQWTQDKKQIHCIYKQELESVLQREKEKDNEQALKEEGWNELTEQLLQTIQGLRDEYVFNKKKGFFSRVFGRKRK